VSWYSQEKTKFGAEPKFEDLKKSMRNNYASSLEIAGLVFHSRVDTKPEFMYTKAS